MIKRELLKCIAELKEKITSVSEEIMSIQEELDTCKNEYQDTVDNIPEQFTERIENGENVISNLGDICYDLDNILGELEELQEKFDTVFEY